ncbi:hypothetical protein [Aestuariivivens sediminis]|uniref:hypothetical protein n=1 Tax=Aestuariivivens sediminis TaxID=2913557 RepID=UPI001F59BB67|nr:hypothetical protein [Aestuariivivens sediminis]
MKSMLFLFMALTFLLNCKSNDDDGGAFFGYDCNDCRFVNLLSSCDNSASTKIQITCEEFERLTEIRQSNTNACIEITVNPSDGGETVNGFGRDWFFSCND